MVDKSSSNVKECVEKEVSTEGLLEVGNNGNQTDVSMDDFQRIVGANVKNMMANAIHQKYNSA